MTVTLRDIWIDGFQSLRQTHLELRPLTVVVGQSSSGKSALVRAIRTLVHNSNSSSFVTVGKKQAKISAHIGAEEEVTLERGPSKAEYSISWPDEGENGPTRGRREERYPKCGKEVPQQIANIFAFLEVGGADINIAGQFDKPFLLDESATNVAKILGDLTNINVIYDAIKEANRRRLSANAELKVRRADLERLTAQLQEFVGLPDRIKRVTALSEQVRELEQVATERDALANIAIQVEMLETHVATLEQSRPPDVSTAQAEELADKITKLRDLTSAITTDLTYGQKMKRLIALCSDEESELDAAYHEKLTEAGVCPICGQSTESVA